MYSLISLIRCYPSGLHGDKFQKVADPLSFTMTPRIACVPPRYDFASAGPLRMCMCEVIDSY